MIGDNYSKVVSRNYTQQSEVHDAGLPKSAFDLSYQTKDDAIIGRLHILSYQHLMPGTKYRGGGSVTPTLNQIQTPIVPDMIQRSHNFYVPYFSVNSAFRDLMTLNELNGYNKDVTIGAFRPSIIVYKVMAMINYDWSKLWNSAATVSDLKNGMLANSTVFRQSCQTFANTISTLSTGANDFYVRGALVDLRNQLLTLPDIPAMTIVADIRAGMYAFLKYVFDFFCSNGSLLDRLGYPIVQHRNLQNYVLSGASTALSTYSLAKLINWLIYGEGYAINHNSYNDPLQNDTALRCYHAIWIEFYRNVQIQKMTTVLDYHKWDNSLTLGTTSSATYGSWQWFMLIEHVCPWSEDMFTSAQLDDIMRRVYMPVFNDQGTVLTASPSNINYVESNVDVEASRFMTVQTMTYLDNSGTSRSVAFPVPSIVNRALSNLNYDVTDGDTPFGVFDLFSLKRAHMLERYLKRAHFFGNDEYRDVIKGQYGVDLSDLRLNRPHFLGGSTSYINVNQQVSQSGQTQFPGSGSFGERIAVSDSGSTLNIDNYTDFSEEWGMVINLYSVIPQVQYDPLCIQNTQVYPSQYPVPVLCQDFETIIPAVALARGSHPDQFFGHAPSAYQYRSRVNEVHGKFLDEYSSWTSARFFGSTTGTIPVLNTDFLECRPNIAFFFDGTLQNGQLYYVSDIKFYTEAPLPAPVETI